MKRIPTLLIALGMTSLAATAHAQLHAAPGANPGESEIEAVLGSQATVKRTGPGAYVINGDAVSIQDLVGSILPEKQHALTALQDNIKSRMATEQAATSGMSMDAKRAQCQKMVPNSIDRTKCYQELVALRERQTQSSADAADQAKDDQDQLARLDRQIDAITQFQQQYGAK